MADGSATPATSRRIECVPLRARISERVCASVSTRTDARPLGCLGCALGAEVRAKLGVAEPAPPAGRGPVAPPLPDGRRARLPLAAGTTTEATQRPEGTSRG